MVSRTIIAIAPSIILGIITLSQPVEAVPIVLTMLIIPTCITFIVGGSYAVARHSQGRDDKM
jgi:hypothetical protein